MLFVYVGGSGSGSVHTRSQLLGLRQMFETRPVSEKVLIPHTFFVHFPRVRGSGTR